MSETDYSKDSQIYMFNEKLKEIGFESEIKNNHIYFNDSKQKKIQFRLELRYPNCTDFTYLMDNSNMFFITSSKSFIYKDKDKAKFFIEQINDTIMFLFYTEGVAHPERHDFSESSEVCKHNRQLMDELYKVTPLKLVKGGKES